MMISALHQHELAIGIHVFPPILNIPLPPTPPPYPSRLSQSTDFGCPASCIKLDLLWSSVLHMVNVCVSVLFSQIIPHLSFSH